MRRIESEDQLRKAVIRLAHENPNGIRKHLLPLVKKASLRWTESKGGWVSDLWKEEEAQFVIFPPPPRHRGAGGWELVMTRSTQDQRTIGSYVSLKMAKYVAEKLVRGERKIPSRGHWTL